MIFGNRKFQRILTVAGISLSIIAVAIGAAGQIPAANADSRIVRWTLLAGTDSEIFFAIPEKSVAYSTDDYYQGNRRVRIDHRKTVVRRLGDSVVEVDLYQGAAKDIQEYLMDAFRTEGGSMAKAVGSDKNGFKVTVLESRSGGLYMRRDLFRRLDRLYVMTGASRNEKSAVVKEFFESVMLIKDGTAMSPNLNDKLEVAASVKLLLPRPFTEKSEGTNAALGTVEEASAERQAVIIFQPSLQLTAIDSRFDKTFNLLRVKVLLKADGTVGDVETVTKTTRSIEKQAIEAAKGITFLPAEKNGKPVSVYRVIQFSLNII